MLFHFPFGGRKGGVLTPPKKRLPTLCSSRTPPFPSVVRDSGQGFLELQDKLSE
jgi:hypothetical protein